MAKKVLVSGGAGYIGSHVTVELIQAGYEVVVVSTRCACREGMDAVNDYLYRNGMIEYIDSISKEKPPAIVYIDDRAICFDGHPETLLSKIQSFSPWNK